MRKSKATNRKSGAAARSSAGLGGAIAKLKAELKPIREQLDTLSAKYRGDGEDRIAWEVMAAVGALDNTIELAELYASGEPLPTLEEMRGILSQANVKLCEEGGK